MKTALVTGGSKGIGLQLVLRWLEKGYQVITCSRDSRTWQKEVRANSDLSRVDYTELDISDDTQLIAWFKTIEERYGALDVAVNNASPILSSNGDYRHVELRALKETLDLDFWAQAMCLKYELNLMSAGSSLVNMSSVNGLRPTPNASMYSATKHAIEGLTRSLALENISRGVRINAVAPGVTWTSRWELKKGANPNIRQDVEKEVPLKRFAQPKEVVDAIEFLLSPQASYIVGHTLVVDGGLSLAG